MNNKKPTILCVTESSFLSSGYSTYGREVLKRLHALDKFNLIEFGSFGQFNDERALDSPWRYIGNVPDPNNKLEVAEYESSTINKFGAWKLSEVLLDVTPDIVWSWRDFFADEFIFRSPFRNFFHFSHMTTCDATPQLQQWISSFCEVDAMFTYTDWAIDVLKNESGGLINPISSAPAGADVEVFKLLPNKDSFKEQMGLPKDSFVIGTVMRNMKRKLFPDLIATFERFLKEAPKDIANNTYLYLHTSYPDSGWDIPRLLKDHAVGRRVLFTYSCRQCKQSYPSKFQDALAFCRDCGNQTAVLPDASSGVSREVLAKIYNTMDLYIQLATNEGQGMGQVEAAACEVPVFATDYSAMCDVVRKVSGTPIKVQRFFREAETYRNFAMPDLDDLLEKMIWFVQLPKSIRSRMGREARKGVLEHYTYDRTAKIWADHFDSIKLQNHDLTWKSKPRLYKVATECPNNLSDEEWVRWCYVNVLNRPDKVNSYSAMRVARDLNWKSSTGGMGGVVWNDASAMGLEITAKRVRFTREDAMKQFLNSADEFIMWENRRIEKLLKSSVTNSI